IKTAHRATPEKSPRKKTSARPARKISETITRNVFTLGYRLSAYEFHQSVLRDSGRRLWSRQSDEVISQQKIRRSAMTKKFLVFALGIALVSLLQTPSPVVAQSSIQAIGPICFSTAPFVDTLVMFVNASGATANASYYAGNGRDLSGDRVITTNIHIEPGNPATMHFGYTTHPKPGFVPVIAGGT